MRNVLVKAMSQIGDAIDVAPGEGLGQFSNIDVRVGQGGLVVFTNRMGRKNLSYGRNHRVKLDHKS